MTTTNKKSIVDVDFAEVERRLLSMETIEYLADPDHHPDTHGWYIVYRDADGYSYDAIGPYESEEEATHVRDRTRSE